MATAIKRSFYSGAALKWNKKSSSKLRKTLLKFEVVKASYFLVDARLEMKKIKYKRRYFVRFASFFLVNKE